MTGTKGTLNHAIFTVYVHSKGFAKMSYLLLLFLPHAVCFTSYDYQCLIIMGLVVVVTTSWLAQSWRDVGTGIDNHGLKKSSYCCITCYIHKQVLVGDRSNLLQFLVPERKRGTFLFFNFIFIYFFFFG
jgi:hypothetical protein